MAERLRVGLAGGAPVFKLSKPGIEVGSAAYDDLLFDMSTGGYGGVYMSGSVLLSAFTAIVGSSNFYGFSSGSKFEISLGKTFATLPKVLLALNDPILGAGFYGPQYDPDTQTQSGGTGGCNVQCKAQIEADKVTIFYSKFYSSGTNFAFPAKVGYVIYHS